MGKIHCDDIRNHIKVVNGYVHTPREEDVDIFSSTSKKIKKWEPRVKQRPYEELSKIYLDIETDILPDYRKDIEEIARKGRIRMIGLMNEKGTKIILRNESEFELLREFRDILEKKQPDLLFTFNGVNFDLVYLMTRFQELGVERCPFWRDKDKQQRFGAAALAGRHKDEYFCPVYVNLRVNGVKKRVDHIDLYQLAIAYDSVIRKFDTFSLKSLPIEMGLRKEPRLEMSPLEMQRAYESGDYRRMTEYLAYDLDDTKLLADALMPSLYYQGNYFPGINKQKLVTTGNASKWLTLLDEYYGEEYTKAIAREPVYQFKGAITRAVAGLHKDVAMYDFSGQYPSCMMQYGIHSQYDPDMTMLGAMKHAVDYRGSIKYKEGKTKQDEDLSTAVKPVINSCLKSTTPVLTDKGIYPVFELIGKKVNVLNQLGNWVEVEFKSYGVQKLYRLTLKRKRETEVIYTTGDHKWNIQHYDNFYKHGFKKFGRVVTTSRLKTGRYGDLIPNMVAPKPCDRNQDYANGVVHGIVYEDGQKKLTSGKAVNYNPENGQAYVTNLIGNKKELESFFYQADNVKVTAKWDSFEERYAEPLVRSVRIYSHFALKELPDLGSSNSYLLGFFRGLMATDGTVNSDKAGVPCFTMQEFVCDYLNKIAPRIGFKGFKPYLVAPKGQINIWGDGHESKLNFDYYRVTFQLEQFDESDFLRSEHKKKFSQKQEQLRDSIRTSPPWRVESVEETNLIEEVYCCVEMETHTFTLGNGILTRNCYGSLASIIPYGDSIAAATVTLFARARIKWAISFIENLGGEIVLSDTDSLYIKTSRKDLYRKHPLPEGIIDKLPFDASEELLSAVAIGEELKRHLPEGVIVDFDGVLQLLFVPPSSVPSDFDRPYKLNSKNGKKYLEKCLTDPTTGKPDALVISEAIADYGHEKVTYSLLKSISDRHELGFPHYQAIKKNYIKLQWNSKLDRYDLKAKGKFVKRDKYPLEREFQMKYLSLLSVSKADAEEYYHRTYAALYSGNYPIEKLSITRTIRVGEINLIKLGIGKLHERVKYYYGFGETPTTIGAYDINFYISRLKRMREEMGIWENDATVTVEFDKQLSLAI